MMQLLDIDLDYMVKGTAGASPRPPQELSEGAAQDIRLLLGRPTGARWFMDEHRYACDIWSALQIRNARCWHVDAHHDLYGSTDVTTWRVRANPSGTSSYSPWTSATYLLYAWRAGIVQDVVWVVPDWLDMNAAWSDLRREMGDRPSFIHLARLCEVDIPRANVTTVAWSRRWIESRLHSAVSNQIPASTLAAIADGKCYRRYDEDFTNLEVKFDRSV